MTAEGSDVQRRAAVGILQVRLLASGDQLLDLSYVAIGGGGMQAGVDLQFTLGRRGLREQRAGRQQQCQRRREQHPEMRTTSIHGTQSKTLSEPQR